MVDVALRCRCGLVTGIAHDVTPQTGIHLVCHCIDCRAYAHAIGRADVITAHGGSGIFQLAPKQVRLKVPAGQLSCLRLSEEGLLRWYTTCCQTPVGNSLAKASAPFFGMLTAFMDLDEAGLVQVLGPPRGILGKAALHPPLPAWIEPGFSIGAVWQTVRFMARGLVTGAAKPAVVFDATGAPLVTPRVLTAEERATAYAAAS